MSTGPFGQTFNFKFRLMQRKSPASRPAEAESRLPKLRPCEIASAVELEAVRRELDDLLSGR
ncbi:hypothetical protein [Methylobacterium oxalidis]|uniref:hypothetical protein n=1 Tax=Methylobacterium oxalidis TaxID=944322 RepID=UPI00331525B0